MQEKLNLITFLSEVKDPRRKQGQRYKSVAMLIIIIMCALRNKFGYREISRFCKNNEPILLETFKFNNHKVPSYVTFRSFIKETDFESLQTAFHKWANHYVQIDDDEWLSIDGKCIRSTVSDYSTEYQNFVSLVSVFCRKREQILLVSKIENKKSSEIDSVDYLLDLLDIKDAVLTLDALHCKKNSEQNRRNRQSLCSQSQGQSTEVETGS
jgi:hypothetical protein